MFFDRLYIVINMHPDQTAPWGFIVFASPRFASMVNVYWSAIEFVQQK